MTKTFTPAFATRSAAILAALFLLVSCGGGGGGGGVATSLTVAGGAQKGPYLAGAVVTAWRLDASTGARTATSITSTTDANGNFNVAAIPWTGLTEINVVGRYFDEVTNANSTGSISLSALVDLQENTTVRVNLYTHLLAARIRALMAAGNAHAAARGQALAELADRFDLALIGGVGPEALNLTDGTGTHRQDNANLLLFSAAMLRTGIDSQVEVDALRDDFASSGRIGDATFVTIKAAASGLVVNTLRDRLVTRYPGTTPPDADDLSAQLTWASNTLNDTGVTQCSNGSANVACPVATHPTQDAQSGRDANTLTNSDADGHAGFSWTKLDASGNPLAIGAASWSCVRDNVTGLVWEAKTDGGTQDKGNAYTYANAAAYVATVNALPAPPCGYTDWRLPTPQELASQADSSLSTGAVAEATAFPEQKAAAYWSSLANKGDATRAWYVEFSVGFFGHQPKDGSEGTGYVRLVRSTVAPPATRYTVNGDGTLTDHQTGLMWRVCSDGLTGADCAGAAHAYSWQGALLRAATVNADKVGLGLGHDDWRLPNRNEMGSIVDYSRRDPAIDTAEFVGVRAVSYWTSTPDASNPGRAWFVDMKDGGTAFASHDDGQGKLILLVRDL